MDSTSLCYLCHKDLSEDTAFCESCGNFICTSCLTEISPQEYDSAYPVGICRRCGDLDNKKSRTVLCPKCGAVIKEYRAPLPTVDIIIECQTQENQKGVVLIMRNREPRMWALPGGFCEYGESLEQAAVREAEEETGLKIKLMNQFQTYSDPSRDPRHHSITTVFVATSSGKPVAGDDADEVGVFNKGNIPEMMAFDHREILNDYFLYEETGSRPHSHVGRARKP